MKDARYLIRLQQTRAYQPTDQAELAKKVRALATQVKGKAINLRVSPVAIEFDLFCEPKSDEGCFAAAFKEMGSVITCKRLDLPTPTRSAQTIVTEAKCLFNEHRFWEVHEVLEGLWKATQGQEKQLIQGLILAAASLVHAQKNEMAVVWTMLEDALGRLRNQPPVYYGWDIGAFQIHFRRVLNTRTLEIPTV